MNDVPPHQYIKVRATTRARKEKVVQSAPDTYSIMVREAPQNNAANDRIKELLARTLTVPVNTVTIIKGHHHPSKTFIIR